jgi:hypothetical protein
MDSILTVVSPASSYDLVDLETVKDELGIPPADTSQDARIQRWITATSARLSNICGVVFPEEDVSEVFRLIGNWWGGGHPYGVPIRLRRRPVTFITGVLDDTGELLPDGFETDLSAGLIYKLFGNTRGHWSGSFVSVRYSAGYYPIPADIQDATLALVRHKYSSDGRDPLLRRFSIENVGAEDYWVPLTQQNAYDSLPPDLQPVADTIAYYRDHVVR